MITTRTIDTSIYNLPDENCTLFKYMDLSKFLYLVTTRKLYMHRLDDFEDIFESTIPDTTYKPETQAYKFLENSLKVNGYSDKDINEKMSKDPQTLRDKYRKLSEKFRVSTHITCFHNNDYESAAMWKLYCQGKDGIAIKTTANNLIGSIDESPDEKLHLGKVAYSDFSKEDIDFVIPYSLALNKRKSFEHEKEIRLFKYNEFFYKNKYEDLRKTNIGFNVENINIETFISEILISPYAESYIQQVIEDILKKCNYKIKVTKSTLYDIKK